jgi:hypothetical protein
MTGRDTRSALRAAPYCLRCRRPMCSGGRSRVGRPRWDCRGCGVACAAHTQGMRARTGEGAERRPWCVACRHVMSKAGGARFRCPACRAYVTSIKPDPKTRKRMGRPALREHPEIITALMQKIRAALPGYLTPDEREDACQSIMLDILAGRLRQRVPERGALRRYAAEARGMAGDRFRFISLSAPTRDGREFGDTLAA